MKQRVLYKAFLATNTKLTRVSIEEGLPAAEAAALELISDYKKKETTPYNAGVLIGAYEFGRAAMWIRNC